MSVTPGVWGLRGVQIRADGGRGQHIASYVTSRDDGLLLAAAPRLLAFAEKKARDCYECDGKGFYPPHGKLGHDAFSCTDCEEARACIKAAKGEA